MPTMSPDRWLMNCWQLRSQLKSSDSNPSLLHYLSCQWHSGIASHLHSQVLSCGDFGIKMQLHVSLSLLGFEWPCNLSLFFHFFLVLLVARNTGPFEWRLQHFTDNALTLLHSRHNQITFSPIIQYSWQLRLQAQIRNAFIFVYVSCVQLLNHVIVGKN